MKRLGFYIPIGSVCILCLIWWWGYDTGNFDGQMKVYNDDEERIKRVFAVYSKEINECKSELLRFRLADSLRAGFEARPPNVWIYTVVDTTSDMPVYECTWKIYGKPKDTLPDLFVFTDSGNYRALPFLFTGDSSTIMVTTGALTGKTLKVLEWVQRPVCDTIAARKPRPGYPGNWIYYTEYRWRWKCVVEEVLK